jgi:hypothetical protein
MLEGGEGTAVSITREARRSLKPGDRCLAGDWLTQGLVQAGLIQDELSLRPGRR